jgi:hypothetical protein
LYPNESRTDLARRREARRRHLTPSGRASLLLADKFAKEAHGNDLGRVRTGVRALLAVRHSDRHETPARLTSRAFFVLG